jgi:hypothetical protein
MNNSPLHTPTLATVISQALASVIGSLHSAMPGQIESYDYKMAKADVLPLLNRTFEDGTIMTMPVVKNIPVIWPRTSQGSITFPLQRGDGVLLIFSERSLDEWLSQGGSVAPKDQRTFDLSDAIAIPGLYSFAAQMSTQANNEDFKIIFKDQSITLKGDSSGEILIGKDAVTKLVNDTFKDLFNNHKHFYWDAVTSLPLSTDCPGVVSGGITPIVAPTGPITTIPLFKAEITNSHLTSKVKAE